MPSPRSPKVDGFARPTFPQEIWWLVAQQLTDRRDFGSLFLCARLSRGMATVALPLLYSIHDQSPAINAHILDIETSVCLWRSIIASSLGETLYPYCCWIKALKLGNLHSHLEDLARDNAGLKAQFFSPPLQKLQIRRRGRALNLDAIVIEVANLVTERIRSDADKQDKRVGLTSLEGFYLPTANLPNWVSSLSRLTSLVVRDGSVLTSDVARAIRANCPAFREVECYYCKGTDADEELAGFFKCLEPNTLESFTVLSVNEIGAETFKALREHSRSLKTLGLFSLERPGLQSLNELGDCLALESLTLEAASSAQLYPWATECKGVFGEVIQWLQKCSSLRALEFMHVPSSTTILAHVLKEPSIRLTTLSLEAVDVDNEFYSSLTRQSQLRHLLVKILDDDLLEDSDQRHLLFADAVCYCHQLRDLDTNELFTVEDLDNISTAVPTLEEIVLNGDSIDDEFLIPLSRLSRLNSLNIFNPSNISAGALLRFLDEIGQDPAGRHEGLQVYIANQNAEFRFSDEEEAMVASTLSACFKGRFEINYRQDPDELHESDFSD
ncbi:hypothetical protein MFIFM68171_10591 [Madurella fahalii]|uniref:F-box domain-containing protein n=1 Tax=Madurella fahalii TaxID=1157608 RepID=A0ABQ0GRK8_9PEZI